MNTRTARRTARMKRPTTETSIALVLIGGFLAFVALGAAPFRISTSASNAITPGARFTDGNVTVSSRYQGSPAMPISPGGSQTFTLTKETFSGSTDCSTGGASSATVTGVGNPSPHTFALASDGSARLTAPQVSDQNGLFVGWTSTDGGMLTQIPFTDGRAICVPGGAADHTYVATYSPGVIVLDSTCTTPVTSINIGCTVCAKVFVDDTGPGTLAPLRVQIGDFNGIQRNLVNDFVIAANLQTFTFTLPSTPTSDLGGGTFSNIGTWFARVIDVSAGGRSNYANFDVAAGSGCGGCTLTCPANITQPNSPNQCGTIVSYSAPTTSGSCGTIVCSPASGSFYPVGTTTVTCTPAAGPSCSFTITVNDTQPPSITCPVNVAVANSPNQCGSVVNYPAPTVSDNCPGGTTICSPGSGSFFPVGTTTITCTATDASGNPANCSFTVTVNDTQPPSITCPSNITQPAASGQCSAVVNYTATASDNCPGVTAACNPQSGSTFPVGATGVTCTATDASNNTSTCSFTVTVQDTQLPIVSCSVAVSSLWPPNHNLINVGLAASATDNCPGPPAIQVLVFGDEDDESATGDGNHSPDAKDIAPGSLRLRSERKGDSDGRVYLIVVRATDSAGNVGVSCCAVVVPKSNSSADKSSVNSQSAAACAYFLANGVPPPSYFVVGDGPVIGPKQ